MGKRWIIPVLATLAAANILCGGNEAPHGGLYNGLRCRVTAADPSAARTVFETGEYLFDSAGASVAAGSRPGLDIGAGKVLEGGKKIGITLHLPPSRRFSVLRDGGSIEYEAPPVPFALTDGDFPVKHFAARGQQPEYAYIHLEQFTWNPARNSWDAQYLWFERFIIRFGEFRIRRGRLYLNARFEGSVTERHEKAHGAGLRISGEIDISNRELGLIETDD